MMTRQVAYKEMESKLKLALKELKISKDTNAQLLQEREDSEAEITKIITSNTEYKKQLSDLHNQYMDILEQKDKLQYIVDSFNQCSYEHERALNRITELEISLHEANKTMTQLEQLKESQECDATQSLFSELVDCGSYPKATSPAVIDLISSDNSLDHIVKPAVLFNSHKKLKKYIKIRKFLCKTQKIVKQKNCIQQLGHSKKECISLVSKINSLQSELQQNRSLYDAESLQLQSKIDSLEKSLHNMTNMYTKAQEQIREHITSFDNLLEVCNDNMERFESFTHKQINLDNNSCQCALAVQNESVMENVPLNIPQKYKSKSGKKTIVISDSLGKQFGSIISSQLTHSVINMCSPGATFEYLIGQIDPHKLDINTNIVLMIGDSLNIKKRQIIKSVEKLILLHESSKCKFVICAFPYSNHLSVIQNEHIYKLNQTLYNLTNHHSDAIFYFDTNKFISGFKLTRDTMYLPLKYKRNLATLLAYNLNDAVTCSVTKSIDTVLDCGSSTTISVLDNCTNACTGNNLN